MPKNCPNISSLAIVAGGGALPDILAARLSAAGVRVFAVRLVGHAGADTLAGYDGIDIAPAHMGAAFKALKAQNISDLVMIGRMRRPALFDLRPDFATLMLLPRLLWALCFKGDDALLRAVRRVLEGKGFVLHGVHAFMDDVLAPIGPLGQICAPDDLKADIAFGMNEARALGARDAGQAVIVRGGALLGSEEAQGTDALIKQAGAGGAILVKCAKPGQDRALDLPTIGPDTVQSAADAGLAGIVVEAGSTLVAQKEALVALADQHGIFVMGVK